jgi:glutathione S-transferase
VLHVLPPVPPGRSLMTLHRFNIGHPEKLPSAQTRQGNEIKHVVGVLGRVLANRAWLVGEKCTYAHLAFVIWSRSIDYALKGGPMV